LAERGNRKTRKGGEGRKKGNEMERKGFVPQKAKSVGWVCLP